MKLRSVPLVVLLAACQPAPDQGTLGSGQASAKSAMPSGLQGRYRESWGSSAKQGSEHRFDARSWEREEGGRFPGLYRLDLVGQRNSGPGLWQLRFRYAKGQSIAGQDLRIDLYQSEPALVWLCIHPASSTEVEGLDASSANTQDLQGRGCYGRPWRKLEKAA